MVKRIFFSAIIFTGIFITCSAQNFSGLQGKKLYWAPDLGSVKASFIGRLFGTVEGNIDSVVVTGDYETELQLMIYYTAFVNGYFNVSTMDASRKIETHIESVKFSQSASNSPAACALKLKIESVPEPLNASPYLRIEIAKKEDGRGKVKVFNLKKKWAPGVGGGEVVPDTTGGAVPDSSGAIVPVPVAPEMNFASEGVVIHPEGSVSMKQGFVIWRREKDD